ncbi:MAG TPA: hypothetical protein VK862_15250 [Afifellaceae bacterium]|nr:hypothetical protein [Afifellaceae bacterium]
MIRRSLQVVLFATIGLSGQPALADAAGEDLVRSALNDISAAAGWTASADIVRSEGDRVIVEGLAIANTDVDFRLTIGNMGLAGLSERDGGYFADRVSATGMTVDFDFSAIVAAASQGAPDARMVNTVTIGDADASALFLPASIPSSSGMSGLLSGFISAYAYLAEVEIDTLTVPSLTVEQTITLAGQDEKQVTRTSYRDARITGWSDGIIGGYEVGAVAMATSGLPTGDYNMHAEGMSVDHLDIGQMVHVMDPGRYAGGRGDLVWKPVVKHADYRRLGLDTADATVTMGNISMSGFDMRQPETPFLAGLDRLIAIGLSGKEPDEQAILEMFAEFFPAFFDAFRVAEIRVDDIEGRPVVSSEPTRIALREISLSGYSGAGIESFMMAGFSGAGEGVEFELETLRFDGIGFPKWDSLVALMEFAQQAEKSPGKKPEVDAATARKMMDIYPTADLFLMENLSGNAPGKPPFKIDEIRVEVTSRALGFMVGGNGAVKGLVFPVEYFDEGTGPNPLAIMNYDRLAVDLDFVSSWDETSSDIDYLLNMQVEEAGDLSLGYRFSGFTETSIERIFEQAFAMSASGEDDFTKIVALFDGISFKAFTIAFTDRSIVERALAVAAAQQGSEAEVYRDQLKNALPFFMSAMPPGDFRDQVIAAAQATLDGGKKTTLSLLPAGAVMIPEIIATGMQNPLALIDLLGARMTVEPAG